MLEAVTASRSGVSSAQAQQPGAQQVAAAGFVARMKALTNVPSISLASRSASSPWPARNVRASSTL
jgi:hypothetical protein